MRSVKWQKRRKGAHHSLVIQLLVGQALPSGSVPVVQVASSNTDNAHIISSPGKGCNFCEVALTHSMDQCSLNILPAFYDTFQALFKELPVVHY